jgi:hypothetical protein
VDRVGFEKWAESEWESYYEASAANMNAAQEGWNARQPEIDALKAEVEKLRNAAKPVIDYWFEDDQNRTHDDHNKAFLELSNAYYRRSAMKESK